MGGGLIQLVAYGEHDIHLTGNPEITYFKKIYKKYTHFSIETIKQKIENSINFDSTIDTTIARKGDLISNIFIKLRLPAPSSIITSNNSTYNNWVNNIGYALFEKITLEIGGQVIDTHYGEYYDILSEFEDHQNTNYFLTGKYLNNRALEFNNNKSTNYYIPLKFWFCQNIGSALPIIALQNTDIKLKIKLRKLESLILTDGSNVSVSTKLKPSNLEIYTDYIFLDQYERLKFAQSSHQYLINQVQRIKQNKLSTGTNNITMDLNFPVKELFWVFRHKSRALETTTPLLNLENSDINGNDWFNYSSNVENTNLGVGTYDVFSKANIMFDGHDRFSLMDADYFRTFVPYTYRKIIPNKFIYCYSFCLEPKLNQPSGSANMSRINSKKLVLKNVVSSDFEILIFAINFNILNISGGVAQIKYQN